MSRELIDKGLNWTDGSGKLPHSTKVLVFGLFSLASFWAWVAPGLVFGILALVYHRRNLLVHETDPQYYSGSYKISRAGYVCAIIGLVLSALVAIWFCFIIYLLLV